MLRHFTLYTRAGAPLILEHFWNAGGRGGRVNHDHPSLPWHLIWVSIGGPARFPARSEPARLSFLLARKSNKKTFAKVPQQKKALFKLGSCWLLTVSLNDLQNDH